MTQAVAHIMEDAALLSPEEREDLAYRLVGSLSSVISSETEQSQMLEVQRRTAQVNSGEVKVIQMHEVEEMVRRELEADALAS